MEKKKSYKPQAAGDAGADAPAGKAKRASYKPQAMSAGEPAEVGEPAASKENQPSLTGLVCASRNQTALKR